MGRESRQLATQVKRAEYADAERKLQRLRDMLVELREVIRDAQEMLDDAERRRDRS